MAPIITNNFRLFAASKFKDAIDDSDVNSNLYFFVAKSSPWSNEVLPDTATDTVSQDISRWFSMIALKKVLEANASFVIPRFDWDETNETIYVAYSDTDADLYFHPTPAELADGVTNDYTPASFYVYTDDSHVYKCMHVATINGVKQKATDKPTGTSTSVFETADGYRWKYMYSITPAEILKFVTPHWIPVKTLLADDTSAQWDIQQAAVDGSIQEILVTNEGSGYVNTHSGQLVTGGASSFTLQAGASASDDAYTDATIYVVSGTGSGQSRLITDYVGSTRVGTPETNFSPALDGTSVVDILPTITITGDGTGATAKATVASNEVTKITITAAGTGYHYASVAITGCGGSSAAATAIMSPLGGHGKDAVRELGAHHVMTNVKLEPDESDFPGANDYRIIGLVANIKAFAGSIATATTLSATKNFTVGSVTGTFLADEVLTSNGSGTPTAKLIESTDLGGGSRKITFYQDSTTGFKAFAGSEVITGGTSGATAIITAINNPEVLPFSGNILAIENRRHILRSADQTETVQWTSEF